MKEKCSNNKKDYRGVCSSKKALKIYHPSIQGPTQVKNPAEHEAVVSSQSVIPTGVYSFLFFWQSLASLGDAAELYNSDRGRCVMIVSHGSEVGEGAVWV